MEKLTGVPETMLVPLWAKAVETQKPNPICKDNKAVEIVNKIEYDFDKFNHAKNSQVGCAVRTMLFDRELHNYIKRKPNSIIVNLGAGLDTRYERFKNEDIHCWYDLDLPISIEWRKQFFKESENNKFIAKSILDKSWVNDIQTNNKPVLFIAEGLLMYFTENENKQIFDTIASNFPNSEFLFEMLAQIAVGKAKKHDALKEMGTNAEFKWSLINTKELEKWHKNIKIINEWSYFNYYKSRWGLIGFIARLPFLRNYTNQRLSHIKFQNN